MAGWYSIPGRRWRRPHTFVLCGLLSLLTGAGINGWAWLPTGRVVVERVERVADSLPSAARIEGTVLVVAPHPDDESLAAAGVIQDVIARGGDVHVVFLTNGDGFPWEVRTSSPKAFVGAEDYQRLGRLRMDEARRATEKLGVPARNLYFLGFPDRGLLRLDTRHYLVPFRSPYTRVSRVPYEGTLVPGAPYTGRELERQLRLIVSRVDPDVVLAPSVVDGHPDHRAASYLTTRLTAQRDVRLYYYLVHGGLEWPLPKGLHRDLPMTPPSRTQLGITWQRFDLTDEQEIGKLEALREYRSQLRLLSRFMLAFARDNELLLPAPTP